MKQLLFTYTRVVVCSDNFGKQSNLVKFAHPLVAVAFLWWASPPEAVSFGDWYFKQQIRSGDSTIIPKKRQSPTTSPVSEQSRSKIPRLALLKDVHDFTDKLCTSQDPTTLLLKRLVTSVLQDDCEKSMGYITLDTLLRELGYEYDSYGYTKLNEFVCKEYSIKANAPPAKLITGKGSTEKITYLYTEEYRGYIISLIQIHYSQMLRS